MNHHFESNAADKHLIECQKAAEEVVKVVSETRRRFGGRIVVEKSGLLKMQQNMRNATRKLQQGRAPDALQIFVSVAQRGVEMLQSARSSAAARLTVRSRDVREIAKWSDRAVRAEKRWIEAMQAKLVNGKSLDFSEDSALARVPHEPPFPPPDWKPRAVLATGRPTKGIARLFDAEWYLGQRPDLAGKKIDLYKHYREYGEKSGRSPHPLFDPRWYRSQCPDADAMPCTLVEHYIQNGQYQDLSPHPLFCPEWYRNQTSSASLGDATPLFHYLNAEIDSAANPNFLFDNRWYHSSYLTGRSSEIPLIHYIKTGRAQGLQPNADHIIRQDLRQIDAVPRGDGGGLEHWVRTFYWQYLDLFHPAPDTVANLRPNTRNMPLQIVYISESHSTPGNFYRVVRPVESLKLVGHHAWWVRVEDIENSFRAIVTADIIVIWRTRWSNTLSALVATTRVTGAKLVFDVDDLMIYPGLVKKETIDAIRFNNNNVATVREFYRLVRVTMLHCDFNTAPTSSLGRKLHGTSGNPCHVIPNGYDQEVYRTARKAYAHRQLMPGDGAIRIGYAGGSRTHQKDFAVAVPAIARILQEHPQARLVLFKRAKDELPLLDASEFPELEKRQSQIEWRNMVKLEELPSEVGRFDINLAPLEVNNPFCDAKSELKYFEAALCGVPTVASPTVPFREAIKDGTTGYLAADSDEWYEKLAMLVKSPELRKQIATNAFYDVLWKYGPENRAHLLDVMFRQILSSGRERSLWHKLEIEARCDTAISPFIPDSERIFEAGTKAAAEVGVVIPLYNYGHFLIEALESLKLQTHDNFEVVVVDDASTDDSLDVALQWLRHNHASFTRVVLLRNKTNAGLGYTRNTGFADCDAPYVFALDADNTIKPECLERCVSVMKQSSAAFVYCLLRQFADKSALMGDREWLPSKIAYGNYIDAMAMIRKSAWAYVGGYDHIPPVGWGDFDLWCKFIEKGLHGEQLPEELAMYRVHSKSMRATRTDVHENKILLLKNMHSKHPWLRLSTPAKPAS